MEEIIILKAQRRSIGLAQRNIEHYQWLYRITRHSKKKERHKRSIEFHKDVLQLRLDEYGWH